MKVTNESVRYLISLGEIKLSTIQKNVKRVMREEFSLFSLGIGFDVDYDFLERIAMENRGMAQRIYANHNAADQLRVYTETCITFKCNTKCKKKFFLCFRHFLAKFLPHFWGESLFSSQKTLCLTSPRTNLISFSVALSSWWPGRYFPLTPTLWPALPLHLL